MELRSFHLLLALIIRLGSLSVSYFVGPPALALKPKSLAKRVHLRIYLTWEIMFRILDASESIPLVVQVLLYHFFRDGSRDCHFSSDYLFLPTITKGR